MIKANGRYFMFASQLTGKSSIAFYIKTLIFGRLGL
jgi:hypothetical protein